MNLEAQLCKDFCDCAICTGLQGDANESREMSEKKTGQNI